jgi:hypothetical protein
VVFAGVIVAALGLLLIARFVSSQQEASAKTVSSVEVTAAPADTGNTPAELNELDASGDLLEASIDLDLEDDAAAPAASDADAPETSEIAASANPPTTKPPAAKHTAKPASTKPPSATPTGTKQWTPRVSDPGF